MSVPLSNFSIIRKSLLILPLVGLLVGCPGRHGLKKSKHQSVYFDGQRVCFTVDKRKILTHYELTRNLPEYKFLLYGDSVNLTYPNTCITVSLKKAVVYNADYTVDGKNWYYTFIIDNDSAVLDLGR